MILKISSIFPFLLPEIFYFLLTFCVLVSIILKKEGSEERKVVQESDDFYFMEGWWERNLKFILYQFNNIRPLFVFLNLNFFLRQSTWSLNLSNLMISFPYFNSNKTKIIISLIDSSFNFFRKSQVFLTVMVFFQNKKIEIFPKTD